MISRWSLWVWIGCFALLLGGCVVQSFHPYCTEASKVETPEAIVGLWKPVKLTGNKEDLEEITAWRFSKDSVLTHNKENVPSLLDTTFFKIDGELYCDFTAADPAKNKPMANDYWVLNVTPVHTLCKVALKGDRLALSPLDYSWLEKAVKAKEVSLPVLKRKGGLYLYTATPEQWEAFLKEHGKNEEVFSDEMFVFTRVK